MKIEEFNQLTREEQIDEILKASNDGGFFMLEEQTLENINFDDLVDDDNKLTNGIRENFHRSIHYTLEELKLEQERATLKIKRYVIENDLEYPEDREQLSSFIDEIAQKLKIDNTMYTHTGTLNYVKNTLKPTNIQELCMMCFYVGRDTKKDLGNFLSKLL